MADFTRKVKTILSADGCYTTRADEIVKSRRKAMDDYCDSLLSEVTETRAVGNKRIEMILEG